MIAFTVNGAPVPKGRPRFRFIGRGRNAQVQTYTPPETRAAEVAFAMLARPARPRKPLAGPLHVTTIFVVSPPQRFDADRSRDWPHVKPDDDNYRKLVLDALNGIFWHDDGQICGGESFKIYGREPRTFVRITELGPADADRVRAMIGDAPPAQASLVSALMETP